MTKQGKFFILIIPPPHREGSETCSIEFLQEGEIMNKEQKKAVVTLKTARGQIEAAISMIEEGRYCVDISNQIIAASGLLKKANLLILRQHMEHCVKEAFEHDKGSEKIDEIIDILSKITGK